MHIFSKLLLSMILVFSFSTLVKADPIQITSGTVNIGSINLTGNNIAYNLSTIGGTVTPYIFPYQPGTTISPVINAFTSDGFSGYQVYSGSAVINGLTRFGQFGGGYAPLGSSNMIFTLSESFTLPNPIPISTNFNIFSVNIPFTMTGYLVGRNCPANSPCYDIPGQAVFGNGIATFNFSEINGTYRINTYNYSFSSTPEPTPEPATILLLGTGLAGIVGFAKRRKLKKKED